MHDVAVIGGGVVGAAVALALARRDARTILLESAGALATGASGTNSGIVHTGFDSPPGKLETRMILRSADLRDDVVAALNVPLIRCGAVMRTAVPELVSGARRNGVEVVARDDGSLEIPGEAVTDPVAYTEALATAAVAVGATLRTGFRVTGVRPGLELLSGEDAVRCRVAVNCAGLYADEVARLFGDESFSIHPRKGEFLVFDGLELDRILLPAPSARTKGVLVFPTVDGKVVAGPTAIDSDDKEDWSVRPAAIDEIRAKAAELLPAVAEAEPVAAYAGLRPAGRGSSYVIGRSRRHPGLVNVAAIRSTGLTASLGVAEHVAELVTGRGPLHPVPGLAPVHSADPWWQRSARRREERV
jgi:glycerol-3-phosphate dehydrogenase